MQAAASVPWSRRHNQPRPGPRRPWRRPPAASRRRVSPHLPMSSRGPPTARSSSTWRSAPRGSTGDGELCDHQRHDHGGHEHCVLRGAEHL